jgi:hypothetical protein
MSRRNYVAPDFLIEISIEVFQNELNPNFLEAIHSTLR